MSTIKTKRSVTPKSSQKIDPMQLDLLEMFSTRKFSKQELIDIKKMIADYYFDKADQEMDKLMEQKGWDTKQKVEEWGKGHYRKKSK